MAKIVKRTIGSGATRYVVDFYDLTGRRRKERFKRERDAKARLGEVLAHRETGELRPRADDIRFRELVADWKLEHWPNLRPNSRTLYSRLLDVHLVPMLGERKLRTITLRDAEKLRARVTDATAGDRRAKGGRVSANLALTLLRLILNYARKHKYVTDNVARDAKARRPPAEERQARNEREVLTPEELRKLFDAADGIWRVFLMTVALTGVRRGEVLGLTWSDIDWASGKLRVRQQMQRAKFAPIKSDAGRRTIAMPTELVAALKRWRLACPKGERDLVFPNAKGSALSEPVVYQQGLRPALRRAGLRQVTLHALRHGYGSILVSAGVSIKTVQVAMGHANVTMTLGTYAHLLPGDDATAARTLSARVFGAGGGGNFSGTSESERPANRAIAGT